MGNELIFGTIMLKSLYIKNFTLIKETRFEPSNGLNIITGETGAGKTILLDALGLTLGERAEPKNVLENKAIIEAEYDVSKLNLKAFFTENDLDYLDLLVIRREITADGKSRAFVNDSPTTLSVLKELSSKLIEIHTQNSALDVRGNASKIAIVDDYAQNGALVQEYTNQYKNYLKLIERKAYLQETLAAAAKEKDYNDFLMQELEELNIDIAADENLENTLNEMAHAEEIQNSSMQAAYALYNDERSISNQLSTIKNLLKSAANQSKAVQNAYERLNQLSIDAKELAIDLESIAEKTDLNPEVLALLNERFNKIQSLLRKHNAISVSDLHQILENLSNQSFENLKLETELQQLQVQEVAQKEKCISIAQKLHAARSSSAIELAKNICTELKQLEIKEANFSINVAFNQDQLNTTGADKITFWFSANKGKDMDLLEKTASGGEMSRIYFAIKGLLANKVALPTLIFDEADTGVSGEVASRMGQLMHSMGQNHQIIAITHLPQVASKGNSHFFVHKISDDKASYSQISKLSQEERVQKIAEMIHGNNPNQTAKQAALDLLQNSN